jgi:hypothetical protein
MRAMVFGHQLFGDSKVNDNMFEKEARGCMRIVMKIQHYLKPLGKTVNNFNDVFMTTIRTRVTLHEVNSPFVEEGGN